MLLPWVEGRTRGVEVYGWTIRSFIEERLLRFCFAEGDDERSQIADLIARIEAALAHECEPAAADASWMVAGDGTDLRSFKDLADFIETRLDAEDPAYKGRVADGTVSAFMRRLHSAVRDLSSLILDDRVEHPERHAISFEQQVTVVDIHNLPDKAKRFVTGVTVKRLFEQKEAQGRREPLHFLVLDELNRYAPRDGWSPIKEILLDVAERGRSLGMVLIGAQQTASEVERRIVANSAFRVVGRLDASEAQRGEYGFLPAATRARANILEPGSMILHQPTIPIPLQLRFPFPAWATRQEEAGAVEGTPGFDDILQRMNRS
jgi:hypothetical protein